jgi:YVTN family beta-propeller protein
MTLRQGSNQMRGEQDCRVARLAAIVLLALPLAGCRPHDFPQYPPNYREYAYVTNGGSATVSIYDVVNVRLDRELPVGQNPVAVAASPTRNEVYVVNSGVPAGQPGPQGSVSVIDTENNRVVTTIPVRRQPVALALDATGARAYVANSGSNSISVLDLKTRREIAVIGTGEGPVALRLSPDGKTLAVANQGGNSVSLIDPATGQVRAVFAGCPGAGDLA